VDCKNVVDRLLPSGEYEVRRVLDLDGRCLVDFKRRHVEVAVDCDIGCEEVCGEEYDAGSDEWEECFDECVEDCEENKSVAETGSMVFDKDTLSIKEATIPMNYDTLYGGEFFEEEERKERERRKLIDRLREHGCRVSEAAIHPHEIYGGVEGEEEPAIAYLHVEGREEGRCRVGDVLREVERFERSVEEF